MKLSVSKDCGFLPVFCVSRFCRSLNSRRAFGTLAIHRFAFCSHAGRQDQPRASLYRRNSVISIGSVTPRAAKYARTSSTLGACGSLTRTGADRVCVFIFSSSSLGERKVPFSPRKPEFFPRKLSLRARKTRQGQISEFSSSFNSQYSLITVLSVFFFKPFANRFWIPWLVRIPHLSYRLLSNNPTRKQNRIVSCTVSAPTPPPIFCAVMHANDGVAHLMK